MGPRVMVVGEVLIDVVHTAEGSVTEHVGGSPANVALGLARLGHTVDFATTVGDDERGARCREHLAAGGVELTPTSRTDLPTSVADATLDGHGAATYVFDLHWPLPPVPITAEHGHVHTGSIATTLEPGCEEVTAALHRIRAQGTTSYDPNVRPSIMGGVAQVRPRVEELVALSDVVKCSEDDLGWLYAERSPEEVMDHWATLGAGLVVITLGGDGAMWRTGDSGTDRRPARVDQVVDTVGAGDSFMAGLVSGLLDAGLLGDPGARARLRTATTAQVLPAVERALSTSGITVQHAGAYAPTREEL